MVIKHDDEIDGSQADETVRFGLDGEAFELNLSKAHAEELRRSLEPYVKTARKTGSKRNGRRLGSAAIDKDQGRSETGPSKHGMKVSDSGRI